MKYIKKIVFFWGGEGEKNNFLEPRVILCDDIKLLKSSSCYTVVSSNIKAGLMYSKPFNLD